MTSYKFDFTKGDFALTDGKVEIITEQELKIKNKIEN